MKAHLTLNVVGVPELIWACRHEMAAFLRDVADAETSPSVAKRLREVATMFETGQKKA